jgi:DNA-binding transcriptional ArsR family regulator
MSADRWLLLDRILDELNSPSKLPPELLNAVAEHLEEAISSSSSVPLRQLTNQLIELFNKLLRVAPPEAAKAVRGEVSNDTAGSVAYMLGQVSFAQLLASHASMSRADDQFLNTIKDRRYAEYITALSEGDRSGIDLSQICGECTETVSRKLKHLRGLGITDFRREGTSLLNFLTPAARAVAKELSLQSRENAPRVAPKLTLLSIANPLPNHMKETMTFSHPADHARAA